MSSDEVERPMRNGTHASKRFEEFRSMWKATEFCDLNLRVSGRIFPVHKIVLISCSPYFKAMFSNEKLIEHDKKEIELFEVDADATYTILDYLYSGCLRLSKNNIITVLRDADFFILDDVKTLCCRYLCDTINVQTCIRNYNLGLQYNFDQLVDRAKQYILRRLVDVYKTPSFLEISYEKILQIFESSNLKGYIDGNWTYKAIIEWVKYDLLNRKPLLSDIMALVPKEKINFDFYLSDMKDESLLQEDRKCMVWLLDYVTENRKQVEREKIICVRTFIESDYTSPALSVLPPMRRRDSPCLCRALQRMKVEPLYAARESMSYTCPRQSD